MRILLIVLLLVSCGSQKLDNLNSENSQPELILVKTTEEYNFYFHHVKKDIDTLLLISEENLSKKEISKIRLHDLSQIKYLPTSSDTIYFDCRTKVLNKPYQVKSTTAPFGKASVTYFSYGSLPYMVMDY
jgi:hypothetical protein